MKAKKTLKTMALTGLVAASLTAAKLALMFIPNIEAVTLLIMVYTVAFGHRVSLPATVVFVSVEMLIFGINTWVVSYYIHWCALAVVTAAASRLFKPNLITLTAVAVIMTALFGVLTTLVDTLFASNISQIDFGKYFALLYVRGIPFYAVHTVSNGVMAVIFSAPLIRVSERLKAAYFGGEGKIV